MKVTGANCCTSLIAGSSHLKWPECCFFDISAALKIPSHQKEVWYQAGAFLHYQRSFFSLPFAIFPFTHRATSYAWHIRLLLYCLACSPLGSADQIDLKKERHRSLLEAQHRQQKGTFIISYGAIKTLTGYSFVTEWNENMNTKRSNGAKRGKKKKKKDLVFFTKTVQAALSKRINFFLYNLAYV